MMSRLEKKEHLRDEIRRLNKQLSELEDENPCDVVVGGFSESDFRLDRPAKFEPSQEEAAYIKTVYDLSVTLDVLANVEEQLKAVYDNFSSQIPEKTFYARIFAKSTLAPILQVIHKNKSAILEKSKSS